ncbi:TonB-dependent receptor [Sphingomonas sp. ID0503]|uniref:TonB-dependent receptor n=1 Tax=Sphingomonas sp. ID0503 TaxID=3399691 RepID=UPI003AFB2923
MITTVRGAKGATSFLALGCVGFIASAGHAQTAPQDTQATEIQGAAVTDSAIDDEVKVDRLESPKATAPLLDTPQTITVISSQTIRQQNLLTLRDALSTIPGITFGAGEGGGGYGDSINLRGYSANNDITLDGVRDSAQYSRTDPFNLQQIEVYNGANSVFNGSGSVGGTINLVQKTPMARDQTVLEAGVGTDDYYRATVDANKRVSDFVAIRLNAMFHRNDYVGRDVEKYKRWGVAPSVTLGIESPTRATFSYVHQEDNNTPLYGVPFYITATNDGPLPRIDRSTYYGLRNLDQQKVTVDQATFKFEHDFSDNVSIRNLSRWQRVEQNSVTSAPQGTICLDNGTALGIQPNGLACPVTSAGPPAVVGVGPGQWAQSGPRGLVRKQENQLLYNQTDLRVVSGEEGGTRNTLNIGVALTKEDYQIENASLPRNANGSAVTLPFLDVYNPDTIYTGPINYTVTGRSKADTTNYAVYAFDTLELGLLELNAGIRYEKNKARFRALGLVSLPPGTTAPNTQVQLSDENLFSWRVGAVFKPTPETSLYASYANSKVPSSSTVRLGCGVIPAPGAANPCDVAPEKARNFEIGAKADVLDGGLQLTAALFRNERTNFRVPSNDPALPPSLQVLDGKSRVDGVALGATGRVTEAWSIFANYTYLDSKVKQSLSDFSGGGTSADPQRGNVLVQTPKHSGSLWTTYLLPFGLQIGYGLTYQGSFALNQSNLLNPTQYRSDDYLTHRAMLSYAFDNGLTVQLNVQNFTNEKYYTNIRSNVNATTGVVSGGWAMPGEERSARLSLFYSF